MNFHIFTQAAKFLRERKRNKRLTAVFACMAVVVALGTVGALTLIGHALTNKEKVLDCQLSVHQHTDGCRDEEGNLICGFADYVVHMHNDDCYDSEGKLACALPEIPMHTHTPECYEEQELLICGKDEEDGHMHTEECYVQNVTGFSCQDAEHLHTSEDCYDEEGGLACTAQEHQHSGGCYDEAGSLICGQQAHTHAGSCYDEENNLICENTEHEHNESCLAWEDTLTCELEEGADGHAHTEECYETERTLVCGQLELHTHTDECRENALPDGALICGMFQLEEHTHSEANGCFKIVEDLSLPETESTEEKEPAEEPEESDAADTTAKEAEDPDMTEKAPDKEIIKSFEGEGYVVTVSYGEQAEIPEEAELIAEMITPESDGAHYAEREAQFREQMGDENAVMSALLKIGFYVDGAEIEPKAAVRVSVQLLDENGLPEGMPITAVHFAEEGNEVLNGSPVEDGKTSFEMRSFSELAIGYQAGEEAGTEIESQTPEETVLQISEDYEYEDDVFHIDFHIEGEAVVPAAQQAGQNANSGEEAPASTSLEPDANAPAETKAPEEGQETTETPEDETEAPESERIFFTEEAAQDAGKTEKEPSGQEVALQINVLSKNSKEYKAFAAYAKKAGDGEEPTTVRALSYSLTYQGQKLDTSKCTVTAEITPAEEAESQKKASDRKDEKEESCQTEILALEFSGTKVKEVGSMLVEEEQTPSDMDPISVEVTGEVLGAAKTETPNPQFAVQYYANIQRLSNKPNPGVSQELPLIDTTGRRLPVNGNKSLPEKKIYLEEVTEEKNPGARSSVKMDTELTKVYSSKKFRYIMAPSINYFDALVENEDYDLSAVWVLKDGKDQDSTNEADWKIYPYSSNLHFTNREESAGANRIYIKNDAVIRLVYDTTKHEDSKFSTVFYDYDISNGVSAGSNVLQTGHNGINSTLTTGSNGQYAFGNNQYSDFGETTWNGNSLNKANTGSYGNCTFGLAESSNASESIQFAGGVNAPDLFGTKEFNGKKRYADGSLTFKRDGSSYTLTQADLKGHSVTNLDQFWWRYNWNRTAKMYNNSFWPLDGVTGTDPHWGADVKQYEFQITSRSYDTPLSDEGAVDHNCFFGMYYEIEFELVPEYVGPLEYVFFGDDDMWVFLDGELVCDIGGVHSSIGEYVDLWDYIGGGKKDDQGNLKTNADGTVQGVQEKEKHTLRFFYTERGASGSTCWMHFTLPSVISRSMEEGKKDYGHLQINKKVTDEKTGQELEDHNVEFYFDIKLWDKNGDPLPDDYSYWKYNEGEEEPIEADLIIFDGGSFKLKNGQYILIRYLPQGTQYEIIERQDPKYHTQINGKPSEDRKITGTITEDNSQIVLENVNYNNVFYAYELPETGGVGTILYTMAGVVVLIGAGLMYRKKFRERRVQGSSRS